METLSPSGERGRGAGRSLGTTGQRWRPAIRAQMVAAGPIHRTIRAHLVGTETLLPSAAAARAEALDLASLRRRHVVRTASHLAHEPLLLHLAAEVPKGLLELPGILDYDSHSPTRIPVSRVALPTPGRLGALPGPRRRPQTAGSRPRSQAAHAARPPGSGAVQTRWARRGRAGSASATC